MKKIVLSLVLSAFAFFMFACSSAGQSDSSTDQSAEQAESLDVVLLVGGLGDMSFADSAHAGLQEAQETWGDQIQTEVIEFGYDYSVVDSYLLDAADQYDIVIMPSQFVDSVAEHAADYPEVKFWLYGTTFPFEEGDYDNVYAMNYRSNEASFLAGYLAASQEGADTLGFLGGMDNNVINDFWYGYVQGAQYVKEDISVITNYVGSFDDTAKGKELSLSMYQAGASTIFNVAGPVGLGLAEAALESEADVDMIGVDSDQAAVFEAEGREDLAQVVATSVLTNVGNTIVRALELEMEGQVPYGEVDSLGLAEEAVGIAKNDYYQAAYSEDQRQKIEEIAQKIIDGEITVESVYDHGDQIPKLREELAEKN